jgi:hypothetical protein
VSLLLNDRLDAVLLNQGRILAHLDRDNASNNINDHEFKVFSQWGEDGIIQFLISRVPIENRTFVEFGVEDFSESNCRFLLMHHQWEGYILEGLQRHVDAIFESSFYWKHRLRAKCAFITRENINALLDQSGFDPDVGILSIDLDGNDYYVLDAIVRVRPRILICEVNTTFGPVRDVAIPYDAQFEKRKAHFSGMYYGASLKAMTRLAGSKGYSLIGTTTAGNNAFYVRNDVLPPTLVVVKPEHAYKAASYRESTDIDGNLTYLDSEARERSISGMPVFDFESNRVCPF